MGGFEAALDVVGSGEESKIDVNLETFGAQEKHEYGYVNTALEKVQQHLDALKEFVDKSDINEDEPHVLMLAIEGELESSIPSNFKKQFEAADGDSEKAANLITKHILSGVQKFIVEKGSYEFKATDKLTGMIGAIDNNLWGDEVSSDADIADALANVKDIDEADVAVVQAKYKNPNISDKELLAIRTKNTKQKSSLDEGAEYLARLRRGDI